MHVANNMNRPALSFFPYQETVDVVSVGKPDRMGKPTLGDTVTYNCHMSMNSDNEPFLDFMGNQTVYTAKILFPYPVKIKVNDKVIFIDELGKKQTRDILSVQFKHDFAKNVIAVKAVI